MPTFLPHLLPPRWIKVPRDLWSHKMRSLLVVLSIAVGVFAIGTIAGPVASYVPARSAARLTVREVLSYE